PGSKPLPLPVGSEAPKTNPGDELKTLPNPFTVGTTPPPQKVQRTTSTRKITLQASHAVSKTGQAEDNHYLKWKEGETWGLLIGGALKGLPPAKEIAAARLVVPVTHGHAKAATKVGVTLLATPFQKGKAFDYKDLGDVAGTGVVPRQPGEADYNPPKLVAVDV